MKEKASLRIIRMWSANYNEIQGGFFNMSQYTDDLHSLSHTKWNCKYHVVFAPKYRRKAFYEARRLEIGKILRSYTYAYRNTAKNECIRFYGISKRKEQSNDL